MSLAVKWNNEHKQRWANIDRLAEQNRWDRKAKSEVLIAPKPEPAPEPEPVEDGWVERQTQKHKQPFFSIVSAVKVTPTGQPTIRTIQRATCDVYGVKMHDLLSARRTADIVRPRQVSMYLAKELTSLSLPRIGRATGDRDHSTALHAHRKIERLIKADDKLAAKVALIRERLA